MNIKLIKFFAIAFFAVPLLAVALFSKVPISATASPAGLDDVAATYKAKCAACHGPNAAKFFDPAKSNEEHAAIILKGKKGEKPPFMPGFEAKGMTNDEAVALAEYMRSLKKPAE